MDKAVFTALVVANEINLNVLAEHFGMNKKLRWEDALILRTGNLTGIIAKPSDKAAFVFYFGSIVFINFAHHEMMDLLKYLKKLERNISIDTPFLFQDDFKLIINPVQDQAVLNFDNLITSGYENYYLEIIATVLAKSVALEKLESDIDKLYDEIEDIVDYLAKGRFTISDRRLANTSASILRFRYNSISYIMLLDKPDITWTNEEAGRLFDELSGLFELEERYETLRHKTETLLDITQAFTGLTHARRGNRLEWIIIILIAVEIILSLLDEFVY